MASLVELQPGRAGSYMCRAIRRRSPRDVRVLLNTGWTLQSLRAFDLFPMTSHVEVVAVIEPPQVRLATYVFPGPLTPAQSPGQADHGFAEDRVQEMHSQTRRPTLSVRHSGFRA